MPVVTFQPSGKTQEVAEGTSLLAAIVAAGFPLECTCANNKFDPCHLFVTEGKKTMANKTTRVENERLDSIVGVGSKSRLACEAIVGTEPVTIELLGALSG
jgi:2Fe-2S ferredoxin